MPTTIPTVPGTVPGAPNDIPTVPSTVPKSPDTVPGAPNTVPGSPRFEGLRGAFMKILGLHSRQGALTSLSNDHVDVGLPYDRPPPPPLGHIYRQGHWTPQQVPAREVPAQIRLGLMVLRVVRGCQGEGSGVAGRRASDCVICPRQLSSQQP